MNRWALGFTALLATCAQTPQAPELRPVQMVSGYGSSYGPRGGPYLLPAFLSPHSGTDFAGNPGEPVIAPADGTVVHKMGHSYATCGNGLAIQHNPFGRYTVYCHLQEVTAQVWQEVKRGEKIGTVGMTGDRAAGIVLDFPIVHMELTSVPWGHPRVTEGETFDAMKSSEGCFQPGRSYPTDRLVLTYPVRCRN